MVALFTRRGVLVKSFAKIAIATKKKSLGIKGLEFFIPLLPSFPPSPLLPFAFFLPYLRPPNHLEAIAPKAAPTRGLLRNFIIPGCSAITSWKISG
jgi:hypothetical protein